MEQIRARIQGRQFYPDISLIQRLLAENPGWESSRLSVCLCALWDWRGLNGQLKVLAKDFYHYPLTGDFRPRLCRDD